MTECNTCEGDGVVWEPFNSGTWRFGVSLPIDPPEGETCPDCGGSGEVEEGGG